MSDEKEKKKKEADEELQREALAGRKFTIAEAIGRLAGPGMMKGVSPITGKEQADAVIHEYLRLNFIDSAGALSTVLYRHVRESEALLKGFDRPLVVLVAYLRKTLESEFHLKELVRDADVEWGRAFGERPHFDPEGGSPHADDPYTLESVRSKLMQLAEVLSKANK